MSDNLVAELEERLEQAEDAHDSGSSSASGRSSFDETVALKSLFVLVWRSSFGEKSRRTVASVTPRNMPDLYDDIENVVSGGESVPMGVVEQFAAGVSPIRVWREHRGLFAGGEGRDQRGAAVGGGEGGKDGSVRTLAALARVLSVDLDDLVPWPQDCDPKATFEAASSFSTKRP